MAFINAVVSMNNAISIEQEFSMQGITSEKMNNAIQAWFSLYYNNLGDKCQVDPSSNIPYTIVDTVYKTTFGEYELSVECKNVDTDKAEKIADTLESVRAEVFQKTLIGGEVLIKPIIKDDKFLFVVIPRDCYIVMARNTEGTITSVGLIETSTNNGNYYTLLEERTVEDGMLHIHNKLFKSSDKNTQGNRVRLQDQYPDLEDYFTLPIDHIGMVNMKMKMVNCIDNSKDGVSIYAAATDEILSYYWHTKRTVNEYEITEPRLIASADLFREKYTRQDGHTGTRSKELPNYIMALNENPQDVGIQTFNPAPNQTQLEARANQILRSIENIIGLRRGSLSDVSSDDLTATEVRATTARFDMLIRDCETMWEECVNKIFSTCYDLGKIELGWKETEKPTACISWGDGVLYDADKEYTRLLTMVQSGYLKPEYLLALMELHKLPQESIAEIKESFMPNSGAQSGLQFGEVIYNSTGEDIVNA